ncbi:Alpha/Beta hydrolase protein [Xylaria intraflava]|nr:Alpha/Beta hydrolase protein [Xylaria intraflava]
MSPLKLDPEFAQIWSVLSQRPKPVLKDVYDIRQDTANSLREISKLMPERKDVQETKHTVTSLDGTNFDVHRFTPPEASSSASPQRAVVYAFGGGMVGGDVDGWRPMTKDLAHRTGSQVFMVIYRLAPEHRAPAAVEDVYSAVKWLQLHAAEFNVDPKRIVLRGESAGGGIMAGTALMARDKGLPYPLAAASLSQPMLDDRTTLPDDHPMQPYLIWGSRSNQLAWTALLGRGIEERTDENVSIYASPARAKDLSGLPDMCIFTGALDLFVEEDIEFTRRLIDAGGYVEFRIFPGVPHGFELLRQIRVGQEATLLEENFIKRY